MSKVVVYKGRLNVITVTTGLDLSGDEITCEIREQQDHESPLITDWDIDILVPETDGIFTMTIDDTDRTIDHHKGFMDFRREHDSTVLPLSDDVIQVEFRETVTV